MVEREKKATRKIRKLADGVPSQCFLNIPLFHLVDPFFIVIPSLDRRFINFTWNYNRTNNVLCTIFISKLSSNWRRKLSAKMRRGRGAQSPLCWRLNSKPGIPPWHSLNFLTNPAYNNSSQTTIAIVVFALWLFQCISCVSEFCFIEISTYKHCITENKQTSDIILYKYNINRGWNCVRQHSPFSLTHTHFYIPGSS